ncbi:hypothetical protein PAESOLCIP111_01324 [Paenibacillus solanacearum]|uniref:Guanylate cyclase domain-containing protein n=1 Tax=Paenibacillus solanacearum TaxID=2048548 RepID=A0A916NNY3_9BACL|nr:hypothetical protein [Paenibacillus solanacearum]CAG7611045.1 hypothetical protein PAESOLCIP111_01324 [Paenibacillus solanacearum]
MTVELEQYEERVVVFIDILGFREHIKKSVNDAEYFVKLRDTLNIISELKDESDDETRRQITVFSDSIVISYPVQLPGAVFGCLLDVVHIQLEMMRMGILMRGGIAVGQLCHNDNIVYGPAMVEAYELESKAAIYPRVIVSPKVFEAALQNPENTPEEDLEYIDGLRLKDWDGNWYVDFLRQRQEVDYEIDYYRALLTIKSVIISEIEKNQQKADVLMKYQWLKNYYNEVAEELPEDLELFIEENEEI